MEISDSTEKKELDVQGIEPWTLYKLRICALLQGLQSIRATTALNAHSFVGLSGLLILTLTSHQSKIFLLC